MIASSGREPDERLRAKMDVINLRIPLTTGSHQDVLLLGPAMLLDHGVVDMTAIHTAPACRPHLTIGGLHVKHVGF